jgi:ribosome maturation factor RimP
LRVITSNSNTGGGLIPLFLFLRVIEFENMEKLKEKITEKLSTILDEYDAYLVELVIATDKAKRHIHIYLDTDEGINLNHCAKISKAIDPFLEELEELGNAYTLEVSSPGLTRPIVHQRQYKRLIEKKLNISYTGPNNKKINEDLTLKNIDGENLIFNTNNKEIILNFNNIEHAKLRLAW